MEQLDSHNHALALTILDQAQDLTLASIRGDGRPHATTISFASDGMTLYAAIGIDSEKANNIRINPQVALTVNIPYADWTHIQGMSIEGHADILREPDEVRVAAALLLARFPQFATFMADTQIVPWPGTLYIRIRPRALSLLNYAEGFGHTRYFELA